MTQPLFATPAPSFDRLACADALVWLSQIPDETVDLVMTDPAYESLEKHRAKGATTRLAHSKASSNDWFAIFPNDRFPALFRALYRVLRKNAHCYVMCDEETMWVARPMAEAAGFHYWKSLIWLKPTIGMGYHWRNRTERILFLEKGKRKLRDLGAGDVIEAPRIRDGYPTEKPPAIAEALILNSSAPGELVIDPFMGSGSTGFAAEKNGRRFAGCDIEPKAVAITKARLVGSSDVATFREAP